MSFIHCTFDSSNNKNTKNMNNVGEVINTDEFKKGRHFDVNVTLAQLKGNNIFRFMSWGADGLTFIGKKATDAVGFRMKVRGHHHKGYVYIRLNGGDLYDVYYTNSEDLIKNIDSDVYADMIAEMIDKRIEYIPEYKN